MGPFKTTSTAWRRLRINPMFPFPGAAFQLRAHPCNPSPSRSRSTRYLPPSELSLTVPMTLFYQTHHYKYKWPSVPILSARSYGSSAALTSHSTALPFSKEKIFLSTACIRKLPPPHSTSSRRHKFDNCVATLCVV